MSQEIFESVPLKKPKRSNFNLSHEVKGTTDGGILTPFFCEEVLPGDKWKMRTELLMKAMALSAPIMHEVNIYQHFFFVPYRLIWEDSEEFFTGGEDGLQKPVYPTYTVQFSNGSNDSRIPPAIKPGCLADYLDIPVVSDWGDPNDPMAQDNGIKNGSVLPALPFRAYQLIWNEYYRDQNLQDPIEIDKSSGNRVVSFGQGLEVPSDPMVQLRYRCWRKDYFTSALPFAQRGPDVRLPIDVSDTRVVLTAGQKIGTAVINGASAKIDPTSPSDHVGATVGDFKSSSVFGRSAEGVDGSVTEIRGDLTVNEGVDVKGNGTSFPLSNSNGEAAIAGPTINEVRRSIRAQEFFERQARGGGRYKETIFNQFGVVTPDARLQRPEYLGGGVQPLVVNELLQTSQTTKESPQGTQTGNIVSLGTTPQFKRFFNEHGIILGIMSIVPKASYQNGMPRKWLRRDRFDFAWPVLANIGEQEIKKGEIYYSNDDSDDETFGYTPRYSEYKYIPSSVHGSFRGSMSFWHLGRQFINAPGLNGDFVSIKPQDFDRIFPVKAGLEENPGRFYYQMYLHCRAKRALPKFGVPTL